MTHQARRRVSTVGRGELVAVSENVPVAVAPAASVTVDWKVDVPSRLGVPSASPDGLSVSPPGSA